MSTRITLVVTLAAVALAAPVAPASAVLLSLTAGAGAPLAPFRPGQTATGSGQLTATDPNPTWTLTVSDPGTGAGHMVRAGANCTGSDPQLSNLLSVAVTSLAGGVTSAGSTAISATAITVASGTSALLVPTVMSTNYAQMIPASQATARDCHRICVRRDRTGASCLQPKRRSSFSQPLVLIGIAASR